MKPALPPTPKHLGVHGKKLWSDVVERYVLESQDAARLLVACRCLDEIDAGEAAIRKAGLVVSDRYGCDRAHPAIKVVNDARVLLLRSLRELGLDVELPVESRIPKQERRYK